MTTEKQKKIPDLYIFMKNEEGESLRVGSAFKHTKGNGYNILIDNERFSAFPPKAKPKTNKPG